MYYCGTPPDTDWQKELIGGTAQFTTLTAGLSGGNASTKYLLSGSYQRETSVFPVQFYNQKGTVHFNINSTSTNQKLNLQITGNYMLDNNHLPNVDLTAVASGLEPNAPNLYNSDGTNNWQPNNFGSST